MAGEDIYSQIGELCNQDDSIGGVPQMHTLVSLVNSGKCSSPSAEELVICALLATKTTELLTLFSHSAALNVLNSWLQQAALASAKPDASQARLALARCVQLLRLLQQMPMSIGSLTSSGIGKTVNKLKKEHLGQHEVGKMASTLIEVQRHRLSPLVAEQNPSPLPFSAALRLGCHTATCRAHFYAGLEGYGRQGRRRPKASRQACCSQRSRRRQTVQTVGACGRCRSRCNLRRGRPRARAEVQALGDRKASAGPEASSTPGRWLARFCLI
jgi:hypothetical protein